MLTVRSAVPVMSSVDGNEREEDRRCPELGLRGDVEGVSQPLIAEGVNYETAP
jgi:hypothetical protein